MFWLLLALFAAPTPVAAHEVRPAYLEITEAAPGAFTILWKQPAQGDIALRLTPHLSTGWLDAPATALSADPSQVTRTWRVRAPAGRDPLAGVTVGVDGLETSITDVLVRVTRTDGRTFETILRPAAPSATIGFAATGGLPVPAYLRLGVEHILTGIDHLSFVFGLMLLIGLRWQLLKAITAFTVAHSITLAASALGLVRAPPATVEALVALSILFLAVELMRPGEARGVTRRHPWIVAFTFGLLHGFAFAGALRETGLPPGAIPQALLLFNLGVEAGQLMFVATAGAVLLAARRAMRGMPEAALNIGGVVPRYALGSFAAFWLIQRTASIFA